MEGAAPGEFVVDPASTKNLKTTKWRLAVNLVARAKNLESSIHAVERVPSEGQGQPAQFIPIRFIFTNKLTRRDKLLLVFDVFALSEMLGSEVGLGKIIHGDDQATLNVKTSPLASEVRKLTAKVATLLSSLSAPDLALNRHCAECEFQARCRQKAIEADDLSLLSGMTEKERNRHRSKGIFTVNQLSYTFRPRRTPKRAKNPAKPHYLALQALSIRENTVYIHSRKSATSKFKVQRLSRHRIGLYRIIGSGLTYCIQSKSDFRFVILFRKPGSLFDFSTRRFAATLKVDRSRFSRLLSSVKERCLASRTNQQIIPLA